MPVFQGYKIAAGYNNAVGLVNIGLIVPSSNIAFFEPVARPSWNPGIQKIRLDVNTYTAGYKSQKWLLGMVTFSQYDYLLATYCGGGQSGFVTITTRYRNVSYFNANAVLNVPTPDELDSTGQGYKNVGLTMRKIIAL